MSPALSTDLRNKTGEDKREIVSDRDAMLGDPFVNIVTQKAKNPSLTQSALVAAVIRVLRKPGF